MPKRRYDRSLLEAGAKWIARNDNAGMQIEDTGDIEDWLTVHLIADLSGYRESLVAAFVVVERQRNKEQ